MRMDNLKMREYYLKEAKSQEWSVRQLQRNINSHYYERLLSSPDKEESDTIEKEIINNLQAFLHIVQRASLLWR